MHSNSDIDKNVDALEDHDWENLKTILHILKPFKDAKKNLEGQKEYVNASLVCVAVMSIRKRRLREMVSRGGRRA
jgi:hypothetical protein